MCNIFYFSPVAVQLLLEQFGADPNLTNSLGMTALHDGVSRKDLEIVRTLIKFGADPTIKSIKDDKSPLDMAAEKDLNEISQVLKTSSYLHNNNALLNGKLDSVATELDSISLTPEVSFFLLILINGDFIKKLIQSKIGLSQNVFSILSNPQKPEPNHCYFK